MDEEDKVALTVVVLVALTIITIVVSVNLRWRANVRDYTRAGYVQKQVPTSFTTIWVKDPNR